MSGQGEKVAHNSNGQKPAGQGGGCIASGPFKDMKVNLGYAIYVLPSSLPQNIH
jgi:tyrosinase